MPTPYPSRKATSWEKAIRKKLRHKATRAEKWLQTLLNDAELFDYAFQKVVFVSATKCRIVDFYFRKAKLMVEVDERYHDTPKQRKLDGQRELELRAVRPTFILLRFTDQEVYSDPDGVVKKIRWAISRGKK